jgi:hypothetical protein
VAVAKGLQVMVENSNYVKPMAMSAPPRQLQLAAFANLECVMLTVMGRIDFDILCSKASMYSEAT